MDSVRQLAEKAKNAIVEAYVNLEGEQDAFRVEAGIKAAVDKRL